jgi:hypothetical protein
MKKGTVIFENNLIFIRDETGKYYLVGVCEYNKQKPKTEWNIETELIQVEKLANEFGITILEEALIFHHFQAQPYIMDIQPIAR